MSDSNREWGQNTDEAIHRCGVGRMNDPKLIKQKDRTTCGQCVVAMLLGISRADAIEQIGHSGITSDYEIWIQCGTETKFVDGPPDLGVVAVQKHKDPNSSREHWTLWWKDKTLDPRDKVNELWPVSKHFVIDWA